MKLETSEEEREKFRVFAEAWQSEIRDVALESISRDVDTLLAEVERLTAKLRAAP